jgi:putative endonuclease
MTEKIKRGGGGSGKRQGAERRGHRGETLAAWYLRLRGWTILARRIKTARGEVDIIARRGAMVAFVEVKWRNSAADLDMAIDAYRLRRVAAAVEAISHRFMRSGDDMRIDVILVAPRTWPRRIVNAWQPGA